ncbi:MAG: hypothetical protein GXP24_12100, partial [Planctomycetes bacterium]|nr:hypothetical protein [Planctomycetota bacterium]
AQASATAKPTQPRPQKPAEETPDQAVGPSYTERLLKAKRQVWQDREKGNDDKK